MPSLSNNLLREKTMIEFLTAMGIDLEGVNVSSTEGLFNFNFNDKKFVDQFASKLNAILQPDGTSKAVRSISLSDIIDQNVALAGCDDGKLAIHRASCTAIFGIIKLAGPNVNYLEETGEVEITLPSPGYVGLLESLKYPHLRLTKDGKVIIDVKGYLKTQPAGVVKIEGLNANQLPMVFVNESTLQSKGIFYATKRLQDLSMEITPYFFVPQTSTPPDYHFAVDVSTSMGAIVDNSRLTILDHLKNSLKKLAAQLFQLQPSATVSITAFSDGVHFLGKFSQANSTQMDQTINNLRIIGGTPLYEVTADLVQKIVSSNGPNNVLLFTDGGEADSKEGSAARIYQLTTPLQDTCRDVARNKFYVFNYGIYPDPLVSQVVKKFHSETVDATSPDFMAAQADPELLKRWAASRDLFTARVVVEDRTKGTKGDDSSKMMLNMSGQLASLKPRICKPGETIAISITDGNDKTIAQGSITVPSPAVSISYPALMTFFEKPLADSSATPVSKNLDPKNLELTTGDISIINSYLM